MKDAAGFTRLLGEVPEMGDHVVPSLTFDLRYPLEIQVWSHLPQPGDLFLGDRQAQLSLAIGQSNPELSPHAVAVLGRKQSRHLGRGVAFVQGILRWRRNHRG